MSFTFTITSNNQNFAPAGRIFGFTAVRTGGTAWTNASSKTAPFSIGGITGALILNMTVTGTDTCKGIAYSGHATGTLTFTETVNGGTTTVSVLGKDATNPFTGKSVYLKGGIKNPLAPILTLSGTKGNTNYDYQVIAVNGSGKTRGSNGLKAATYQNLEASASAIQPAQNFWPRVATINCAPDLMDGTNFITVSWTAIPGATGYDLSRTVDGGNTWYKLVDNLNVTSFVDQNSDLENALPTYTLPTANTTALGSDSNTGLTVGSPVATLTKAFSLCSAGDRIICLGDQTSGGGFVVDTANVVCPAQVNIYGVSRYGTEFNNEVHTATNALDQTHAPYVIPANADFYDCTFSNEVYGQRVFGWGTSDTGTAGCNLFRVNVRGMTNAVAIQAANCGFNATDCIFESSHGSMGILLQPTSCVNLTRCAMVSLGAVLTSGAITVPMNVTGGFPCLRDCTTVSNKDSQNTTAWVSSSFTSLGTTVRGTIFINHKAVGQTNEFNVTSTNNTIWMMNTDYDHAKNPTLVAMGTTDYSVGTYLVDPILLGIGGNAATTGGNFRSNQSAVTSGGVFGETRT